MRIKYLLGLITLAATCHTSALTTPPPAPLLNNLGKTKHVISTKNALAQRYFNQGLALFYGFEWGESIRSFQGATKADPNCAICYWGLALALGAKANAPMNGHEYQDAKAAIEKAVKLEANATPEEQAYINALALRFQHPPKPLTRSGAFNCHGTGLQNESSNEEKLEYADAMKKLAENYPKDDDAKALYAYALFDTIEWNFWDLEHKPNSATPIVIKILNDIIAHDKKHLGANHYYVHIMENSPDPEKALTSARRLPSLAPGSQHIVHMPTHIYFLTGRYHEGTKANLQAIATYQNYSKLVRRQGFQPEITYLYHHDFDFLRTTAAMEGRQKLAISASRQLMANMPAAWIAANHNLQGFITIPYFALARFGQWQQLLKEPMPDKQYQYAYGMWLYARGMALAHTGNKEGAQQAAKELSDIIHKGENPDVLGKDGIDLLTIANEILAATLASMNNDENATIAHLKTAVKIQHDMGYHEPPDWYFPTQEALGYAYLRFHHPELAIKAFEDDLHEYPKNGWALYGIAKSWQQLGDKQEFLHAMQQFKLTWHYADMPVPVTIF